MVPDFHEIGALAAAWCHVAIVATATWALLRRCPAPAESVVAAPAWTGQHVVAAFLIFWLMPALVLPLISPEALAQWCYGSPVTDAIAKSLSLAAASLLALPLQLTGWWALRASAQNSPMPRWTCARAAADVRMAMKAWLALTPIVLAVFVGSMAAYSSAYGKPEEHPLLAPFQTVAPPVVVALLAAEAIIAAPIREELLFRGILLPWMAARDRAGDAGLLFAALAVPLAKFMNGAALSAASVSGLGSIALATALWAASRLVGSGFRLSTALPEPDPHRRLTAIRAIFGSAAIFAICHWGVPPTPVPLAVLAVGLGWLALRTQGVLAPIVVHAMFNAVAFTELFVR